MSSAAGWQTGYNSSDLPTVSHYRSSNLASGWGGSSIGTYSSPLAHPDSWPQLGEGQETASKAEMHKQPNQSFGGNTPQQETSGWGNSAGLDNSKSASNGWGASQSTGWGAADTGGNNWSRQPQVDNGTAVWSKASQSSSGWGAPSNQTSPAMGWGAPPVQTPTPTTPNPQELSAGSDPQQSTKPAPPQNNNPPTHAPESWAAAAAALPAQMQSQSTQIQQVPVDTDPQVTGGNEADLDQSQGPVQPQQPQTQEQKVAEMQENVPIPDPDDAVQKLVNSHEGWGKRPIQQNTSWDISESPNFARQSSSKTGTEAWGKITPGQGVGSGWGEQPQKQAWQANAGGIDQATQQWNKPATGNPPVRGWSVPNQVSQQPRLPWGSSQPNSSNQTSWADSRLPPPMPGMNNNRWPTPPSAMQNSTGQGWGAPPQQANNPIGGWGNPPPTAANSGWGAGMQRNPSASNWGSSRTGGNGPEASWSQPQPNMQRIPSQVDDGTSAWGDPTAYKSVNMWDKKQGLGMGMGDGNQVKPEATGWGAPTGPSNLPNKPPSPTGWGDANPSRPMVDNGSSWGKTNSVNQGSNWDQNQGWGPGKPNNGSGWANVQEQSMQQWGQNDLNSGWNQQSIKNDIVGQKNMDFGFVDRKTSTGSDSVFEDTQLDANGQMGLAGNGRPGMNFGQYPGGQANNPGMGVMNGPRPMPPQPLMNQPNMQAQMMQGRAPPMPLQLQNQLIRNAVMKGIIPQHMLDQLMTPQHLSHLLQLVKEKTKFSQLMLRMSQLKQQLNVPPQIRQSQQEQTARLIQECQQQIQTHQLALSQNMFQKNNQLQGKNNAAVLGPGAGLGLDLIPTSSGALPPSNSSISPFNMSNLTQSLPGPGTNTNVSREQQSRLSTWRRPSMRLDGSADNGNEALPNMMPNQHASISDMIGGVQSGLLPSSVGPGSDSPNQSRITGGGLLGLPQPNGTNSIGQSSDPVSEANGAGREFELNGPNSFTGQAQGASNDTGTASSPSDADQDATGANLKNILADIGPPEFIPGVKWKGFRPIDPENDPDITPGSVAIAKTMSVNTVKDVDQVLNRDRYTNSQVGSPASNSGEARPDIQQSQSLASSFANTLTDNPAISSSAWSTATSGGGSSLSHAPTSLTHELWKVPLPKQSSISNNRPPPGGFPSQNSGWPSAPTNSWPSAAPNSASSSGRYSTATGSENSGWAENKTWVVLTNLNPQMDFTSLRNLCGMKGNMLSFRANYPMRGMVLVKYSTADDALSAKKSLNMSMTGSTMLVASIASDQEVSNFVAASASNTWNTGGNQSRFTSRHSFGSSGTLVSNQQQPPPSHFGSGPMLHGSASTGDMQRLWSSGGNGSAIGGPPSSTSWSTGGNPAQGRGLGGGSSMWGMGGYEDPTRMMSPLHSLLPENLLGGETM